MSTPDNASPNGSGPGLVENIGNLLGLLIAAFVGALNFLGFRSGELSAILRTEAPRVTLVSILMLAALASALASLFFTESDRTAPLTACGWFALCLSIGAFSIALIPIPGVTDTWALVLVYILGSLLLVAAGVLFRLGFKLGHESGLSRKLVIICGSVVLLSAAVLAAGRLETRSQVQATYPRLAAAATVVKGVGNLSIEIEASKMQDGDNVSFFVQGLPRSISLDKECGTWQEDECIAALCHDYEEGDPCRHIGTGVINPDALGKAKQKISTVFSARAYQLLVVEAEVCDTTKDGLGCGLRPKRAILYLNVDP